MRRRLPEVDERDRFGAAALQVDRLLRYMQRRTMTWRQQDPHGEAGQSLGGIPEFPALGWYHYADSSAAIFSVKQ